MDDFFFFFQAWKSKDAAPWNRKLDRWEYNCFVIAGILMILPPAWIIHYKRDYSLRDWGRREAMIIMLEREEAGLPYIDKNFVDPSKLELPTDEELGDAPVYL